MRIRSFFAVLCSAGLIILGAVLPGLIGERMDKAERSRIRFAPANEVRLEFADSGLSMKKTLALLGASGDPVEIPEELASRKRAQVEKIAADTAERCAGAGITPSLAGTQTQSHAWTMLVYGPENVSNVFWFLTCGSADGEFQMVLDDRTGAVCHLEYRAQNPESEEMTAAQMRQALEGFCGVFLEGLGEEFFGCSARDLAQKAETAVDGSYVAASLTLDAWEDPELGSSRIVFFLNGSGFYTYFE